MGIIGFNDSFSVFTRFSTFFLFCAKAYEQVGRVSTSQNGGGKRRGIRVNLEAREIRIRGDVPHLMPGQNPVMFVVLFRYLRVFGGLGVEGECGKSLRLSLSTPTLMAGCKCKMHTPIFLSVFCTPLL